MRNYRDLLAWQVSFELARLVYELTESFPKHEVFGLTAQMRRAAVSIPSNLAEGAGRGGKKDFAHFVTMARASLNELETQLLLAQALGYGELTDAMQQHIERLFALLNGLRNSLNAQRSTQNEHG
ncbi:four helix bundle protein [Limnohabitans sp. DM1]|uniref:four helix bundle protein n=1 Tax=Limnohabitans sp. DM1 TaxID=1597955 RepID=UPI000ADA911F|nr:four helix bundle protein [Limnohabitans sp. DM1]